MSGKEFIPTCPGVCEACPFNYESEASNDAYNLGCLPSVFEVFELKRNHDVNWGCHEGGGKVCAGYIQMAKEEGYDYKSGFLIDTPHYLKTAEIKEYKE